MIKHQSPIAANRFLAWPFGIGCGHLELAVRTSKGLSFVVVVVLILIRRLLEDFVD